jgi:Carboxypeptidase regulatory-like domain
VAHTARKRGASHNLSLALAAAALALLPPVAVAQQSGAVAGVAQDESGAVLPSVTITATNQTTGLSRTTETAADGTFTLDDLPADGEYIIQAERRGFLTVVREHATVAPAGTTRVDFVLKLSAAETVAVSGSIAPLVGERFTVQQTIDERLTHALPLAGRRFMELTILAPGFTGDADFPSAQGQLYWTNNVLIDGAGSLSKWRGGACGFYLGYGL